MKTLYQAYAEETFNYLLGEDPKIANNLEHLCLNLEKAYFGYVSRVGRVGRSNFLLLEVCSGPEFESYSMTSNNYWEIQTVIKGSNRYRLLANSRAFMKKNIDVSFIFKTKELINFL